MKPMSQKAFILSALINKGKVSRNNCLRNYITKCASRISELRRDGLIIEPVEERKVVKAWLSNDFVYYLNKRSLRLAKMMLKELL